MDPHDFLEGATVSVDDGAYAVCRTDRPDPNAFATVQDETETTVVVDEASPTVAAATDVERGWKRLTFDVELPFELVGFLAVVASALADADVSVFVLSAFSTDHVLIKESDLDTALQTLDGLGCDVRRG
ncbi:MULTISPECIES: ACT domain-containing protein [Haloarcula]|uniref:ACT domain-containing protein n=1 Tax=Haloarcula pellucida TaxID=1427151 RepID=A0A830GMR4_9EURY|nr:MULTISPECIES: ACT domain-containing protein [Halomicroarcula]MBX0349966.1 ACT domain-containing protein [Halomicroarcula pellucida]MDS0279714.1 ACT domain-containing protein [Halomicroarcula sp. S1AR25-4]GGN95274.1 ACT domain-containing protein [Halomicroarcula pellucida]